MWSYFYSLEDGPTSKSFRTTNLGDCLEETAENPAGREFSLACYNLRILREDLGYEATTAEEPPVEYRKVEQW